MIIESQIVAVPGPEGDDVRAQGALDILRDEFPPHQGPHGYVTGRTRMRNLIAERTGCSLVRAEQIILELHGEGAISFGREPGDLETSPGYWTVAAS